MPIRYVGGIDINQVPQPHVPDVNGTNIMGDGPGTILDLGESYIGITVGGRHDLSNWAYIPTGFPMAIMLYHIGPSGDPTYVNTSVHEITLPPGHVYSGSNDELYTFMDFDAPIGPNRRIVVSLTRSGRAPFAVIVERQGETVTVGPPCYLIPDTTGEGDPMGNSFIDESLLIEYPDPWYEYGGHAYLGGSLVVMTGDDPGSAVVAGPAQDQIGTYSWSLATRRLLIEGNSIVLDGSWHLNREFSDVMSQENYQWVHGVGSYGNTGYIHTYDWDSIFSLFRVDLATGKVTHGVTTVSGDSTTSFYTGSLVATKNGVISMAFDSGGSSWDYRLVVQVRDLNTLDIIEESIVVDKDGLRLGVWHNWVVRELPQKAVGNALPIVTENYADGAPLNAPIVTLLGSGGIVEQAEFMIPGVDMPAWETGVHVVGANYIIGFYDTEAWGVPSEQRNYAYTVFQWTPPPVVARAGDGMLAQYFTGAR